MITLREVLQSLDELEELPHNWDTAQKLAVMLVLRDHLSSASETTASHDAGPAEPQISVDSEFLQLALSGDPARVWAVLDEMMDALEVMMPRMYDGVMRRLRED